MDVPLLGSYARLETMEPVDARTNVRMQDFAGAAAILEKRALGIAPVEMSIGGPLTIASNLRGVERLLREEAVFSAVCEDICNGAFRLVGISSTACSWQWPEWCLLWRYVLLRAMHSPK